jgi:aryl-alcohol dehydrogenase-like predicted oxidoreductase
MKYRYLGSSELEVSVVAMGCWAIVGDATWGRQEEDDAVEAINAARESGVNFFDTAEAYGDGYSEELLGEVLSGDDDVVIASKARPDHFGSQGLKTACEGSLRRLKRDCIDVYYLHWPNRGIPYDETMAAMEELKEEGKIRVPACSNFGVHDLSELLQCGRVEANQLAYNLLFRAIEFGIQPACIENDVGITCYSPIAQGLLTGKFESPDDVPEGRARTRHFSSTRPQSYHDEPGAEAETFETLDKIRTICRDAGISMTHAAIGWLLSRDGVDSVIAGARNAEQASDNALAGDMEIPDGVLQALTDATESLKQRLGPNPDMWKTESRIK